MGLFDWLKKKAADAAQARVDELSSMLAALPPGTIWAGTAEAEVGHRDDVIGLLSHDGRTVRFQAYRGDLAFEIDASTIEHRRGEAKTMVDGKRAEIDDVRPIRLGLPPSVPADFPPFVDIEELDGPMYGFFSTLGIPV